jgi:hypothetical protein
VSLCVRAASAGNVSCNYVLATKAEAYILYGIAISISSERREAELQRRKREKKFNKAVLLAKLRRPKRCGNIKL